MESSNVEGGGVLKIEVEVLKKLQDRPNTIRLYPASRRAEFRLVLIDQLSDLSN
jgi:hypothetical protein